MPSETGELIRRGLEHHQAGRFREAEAAYRSALDSHPGHPDALHLLGVIAHQTGNNEAAVGWFQRAIQADPTVPDFHNNCGEAYRLLGQYDSAVACYRKAIAAQPDFFGGHLNLGNALKESGRLDEAVECYRRTIEIKPDFPVAHNNLGVALKALQRYEEAVASFERALAIHSDYAEAHNNLGNTLKESGRPEEALGHFERALAIHPGYAEAHSNLGNALKDLGRTEDAIKRYKLALDIKPDFAMGHYNLGIALHDLLRLEESAASYEAALTIDPDYAEAHNNLGNTLIELGRPDDAIAHLERAIAIKPDYAEAHRNLTVLKPRREQETAIAHLLESDSLPVTDAIHCHFALGKIYDDAEMFDKAFEHYQKGNTLKRGTINYSAEAYSSYIDRIMNVYTSEYFRAITDPGSDSRVPVFIVGMPRSGTTLIEQILSSHPEVHGAGELPTIVQIEEEMAGLFGNSDPYPECIRLCGKQTVLEFSRKYLAVLRNQSHDARHVTDKLPANFARIGLIKTLFPAARIIHCRRNALDTCASNFFNYFDTGNDYSFDLGELGQYYLDYERLMAHWDAVFPSEILTVQYEDLIETQESVTRRMIEYIGLDWDERCLEFHKNERAVHTYSSLQVRQPLYSRSINRWKHYERYLAPLAAMLQGPQPA